MKWLIKSPVEAGSRLKSLTILRFQNQIIVQLLKFAFLSSSVQERCTSTLSRHFGASILKSVALLSPKMEFQVAFKKPDESRYD